MMGFGDLGRMLVIMGLILTATGALILLGGKLPGLGRLPGDILIRRGNFTFYFPVVSCLLFSAVLTFLLWVFKRK